MILPVKQWRKSHTPVADHLMWWATYHDITKAPDGSALDLVGRAIGLIITKPIVNTGLAMQMCENMRELLRTIVRPPAVAPRPTQHGAPDRWLPPS